jgi:hypothetical protein
VKGGVSKCLYLVKEVGLDVDLKDTAEATMADLKDTEAAGLDMGAGLDMDAEYSSVFWLLSATPIPTILAAECSTCPPKTSKNPNGSLSWNIWESYYCSSFPKRVQQLRWALSHFFDIIEA